MGKGKKWHMGNAVLRMVFVGLSLLFQTAWILFLILRLNEYSIRISFLTGLLTVIVVLQLYSRHTTPALKLPWIMLIMALPVMGISLYLMFEVFGDLGNTGKRLRESRKEIRANLLQQEDVIIRMEKENPAAANRARYLLTQAGSPVWENTAVVYYGEGADALEAMKRDLEKAESFIFMEYFIVSEDSSVQELQEILVRKARQGVEVRFLYDDMGSTGYVNWFFAKGLNDMGIRCQVFNPALPVLNLFMNHRDHRKITVIDGKVGYTGGFNLADEYFGRKFPYGKWKDTGLRLEGEAVQNLTALFLEMWSISVREKDDFGKYLGIAHSVPGSRGWVQPFGDDPLGEERIAENLYLNMIWSAEKYLYIMTPYLIITDEMNNALAHAAKRGVDVRIITPGIPDKKTVYQVTRSYYAGLVAQGVRVFEYTPGFCHAKQCLCDGKAATIGTSNLDYRSLYYHFENNVLLTDCDAVQTMEQDFREIFPACREVTEQYRTGRGGFLRIWQYLLRLFAPLM